MIPLKRCIIITSYQSASINDSYHFLEDDTIICADGGYLHARRSRISPDVVIGDFDSIDFDFIVKDLRDSGLCDCCQVLKYAAEKDDTDTMICLKYAIEQGFDELMILGGLGGRLDHTIANLQTMSHAIDAEKTIWFLDGKNRATLRNPGKLSIHKAEGYKISLFSYGDLCEGVSIQGVKYPLKNCSLNHSFPLGISNEFIEEKAEISHSAGKLLIILSHD